MTLHTLPALPYAYDALEPYIDAKTMELHHSKHHQTYVDKLNAALEKHPEIGDKTVSELITNLDALPEDIRGAVRNHGGGHFNHSFFWPLLKLSDHALPSGALADAITEQFGSFENFQEKFNETATSVFGSGWAWLSADEHGGLLCHGLPNQDNPLMQGRQPILGLDVWEHAYYLKYQNRRPEYVSAFWNLLNWEQAELNFKK